MKNAIIFMILVCVIVTLINGKGEETVESEKKRENCPKVYSPDMNDAKDCSPDKPNSKCDEQYTCCNVGGKHVCLELGQEAKGSVSREGARK